MGNTPNSENSSERKGKGKRRPKRRTSILFQQFTDSEFRYGKLMIKEHAYRWKEVIYLEQFIRNITEELVDIDLVALEEQDQGLKKHKQEQLKELKERINMSRSRLQECADTVRNLKAKATNAIEKSGGQPDVQDSEFLNALDEFLTSGAEIFQPVAETIEQSANYVGSGMKTVKSRTGVVGELVIGTGELGVFLLGETVKATGTILNGAVTGGDIDSTKDAKASKESNVNDAKKE